LDLPVTASPIERLHALSFAACLIFNSCTMLAATITPPATV